MVKRSIEQDIRNKNFGARNENYWRNAVVKNQRTKQCVQIIIGDCWQWESNGQCSRGDNCSFRHDVNKRGKNDTVKSHLRIRSCSRMREKRRETEVPGEEVPVVKCLDGLARITSKELASTRSVKSGTPPECLFYKTKSGCRFGRKVLICTPSGWWTADKKVQKEWWQECSSHVEEEWLARKCMATCCQPWQKSRQIGATWSESWHLSWVQTKTYWTSIIERTTFGLCLSRHEAAEVYSPEELRHAETNQSNVWNSRKLLHVTLKFETKILRSDIFAQVNLMSVAPNAPKFEDRSQEETEWQEQGAREAAWKLAQSVLKLKEQERATFFSPSENRCLPASTLNPEEREFVVDSGASMYMISKKDLSDAEMDTLTKSCSPTIVITANGEVQTHEEATVYVKELDLFLTMKVIEKQASSIVARKAFRWKRIFLWMDQRSKTTSH